MEGLFVELGLCNVVTQSIYVHLLVMTQVAAAHAGCCCTALPEASPDAMGRLGSITGMLGSITGRLGSITGSDTSMRKP